MTQADPFILQAWKLRHREENGFAQGYTVI